MLKTSCLLLLTLVLSVQLCSAAPISSKTVQSSVTAEEPDQPLTEDHSPFIEEKKSVQEKHIPVIAEEAALRAEEDIPVIAKEPELVIRDQVSDDDDEAASQESAPVEPLATEEKTVTVEVAFAEASPDETTEEVDAAVAESPEQHYEEDPAPEALIPVIPLENSEDEAPEESVEEETVAVESAGENTLPEEHDLENPAPAEPAPVIAEGATEDEAPEETVEEEAAPEVSLTVVPVDKTEEEGTLPLAQEEEESVVLVPAELETKEAGHGEPAAEESIPEELVPEETAILVPMDPAEEEPGQNEQEEIVPIDSPEAPDEEAPGENTDVEAAEDVAGLTVPIFPEENAEQDPATYKEPLPSTPEEEEESLVLVHLEPGTAEETQAKPATEEAAPDESVPAEPAVPIILSETEEEEAPEDIGKEEVVAPAVTDEKTGEDPVSNEPLPSTLEEDQSIAIFPVGVGGQAEPVAEETAPPESAPENPVIIAPLDPAEDDQELEVDLEEQVNEKSISVVSPEEPDEEAPEVNTEVKVAEVPVVIVPEDNAEEDPAIHTELEEPESVVIVHAELDTEEEDQEEMVPEETMPEKPAVIILMETTSEEPAPEEPILIIPLEDPEEDAQEDHTEEAVQSDPLRNEATLEEDTAPQEKEAGDGDAEIIETPSEPETMETEQETCEEVQEAATDIHVATLEPVTAPAPADNDTEAEIVPAPVEGGKGARRTTPSKDFKPAAILIEEEPQALFKRGAVLGAAFFALISFIAMGFVWTTVSKKLR